MIAGNHDTPRAAETGCILRLFAPLGIHVVDARAASARLSRAAICRSSPCRTISIAAAGARARSGTRRCNVLLLHGEVEGMLGPFAATRELRVAVRSRRRS